MIAGRYLLARKSTNAINIISGLSMLGLAIGTAALLTILSVFNGFEALVLTLYNSFNPDIKVVPLEGKVFEADQDQLTRILALDDVLAVSQTLEENALFEYEGNQALGILKGVDAAFADVSAVDSSILRGNYYLQEEDRAFAVVGLGMESKLQVNVADVFSSINVYMPKRKSSSTSQPFKRRTVYPAGTFVIQEEFDAEYILTDISFARDVLGYKGQEVSSLEVKLTDASRSDAAVAEIEKILGSDFKVLDRYKQDASFFRLMNIEKWIAFILLAFAIVLVAFNMVGALWMLVLEKVRDIAILRSLGVARGTIRNIVVSQGFLMSSIGAFCGLLLATFLIFLQKTIGLVRLSENAHLITDAYPVEFRFTDAALVFVTVVLVGTFMSLLPAWRASRIDAIVRSA